MIDPLPISVLLIEDNPGDALAFREYLGGIPDSTYEVEHVARLDDALTRLASQDGYDVIVLDLSLPDSRGATSITRIRGASEEIPVVVLTGAGSRDALGFIQAGAQDFINKNDLDPATLRRALGFAVSRHRSQQQRVHERTLDRYRRLSSAGAAATVARDLVGMGPVRSREPELFEVLLTVYVELLDSYLRQLVVKAPKPTDSMRSVVRQLGDNGGGPRDLLDLHLGAINVATRQATYHRARAYALDGRLLALEMMGFLVDYYRVGIRLQGDTNRGTA